MREIQEWIVIVVYGLLLTAMGRFGLQHDHFPVFLASLFGMSIVAILVISFLRGRNEEKSCRPGGPPQGPGE